MNKAQLKNLNRGLRQKRNRARVSGVSEKPRLSVFRSNKYTYAQLIDDVNGRTIASASTQELKKKGKKTELAQELGALIAEKAKKAGVTEAVFNRSFYKFHGRIKAVAEGARQGGLKI
ncbi:MAG: 50S ribosomal protein L18 [bacterium]|nr:50S ribosomal protein L18 [bacterium]